MCCIWSGDISSCEGQGWGTTHVLQCDLTCELPSNLLAHHPNTSCSVKWSPALSVNLLHRYAEVALEKINMQLCGDCDESTGGLPLRRSRETERRENKCYIMQQALSFSSITRCYATLPPKPPSYWHQSSGGPGTFAIHLFQYGTCQTESPAGRW